VLTALARGAGARSCSSLDWAGAMASAARPRRFVSLWELPATQLEGLSVAALHGGGYRAVAVSAEADTTQPEGCGASRLSHARGLTAAHAFRSTGAGDADGGAVGRTDAWRDKGFASVDEWRAHTRSDLYRLNLHRRASGRAPLTGTLKPCRALAFAL